VDATAVNTFIRLWALVHLVHFLRHPSGIDPTGIVLLTTATVVLTVPRQRLLLGALALFHLLTVVEAQTYVANHSIIMAAVNLILIIGMVARTSWDRIFAAVRITFLIAYGAAAIAKLNTDFFDPALSCTTSFADRYVRWGEALLGTAPTATPGLLHVLPTVVAGAELLVPLLLITRPLRHLGVLLVIPLHLAMSVNPWSVGATFTVLLFAVAFLFLSASAQGHFSRLGSAAFGWSESTRLRHTATTVAIAAVAAWLHTYGRGIGWGSDTFGGPVHMAVQSATLVIAAFLVVAALKRVRSPAASMNWATSFWFIPIIAVVLLNAASPYLGGRTVATFTMYSNLRTEAGTTNHLFIPRVPWTTSLDDVVTLVDTDNPMLVVAWVRGHAVTVHEVKRAVHVFPDARVTAERRGATMHHSGSTPHPELIGGYHALWHSLVWHRPMPPTAECQW